ncbi:MAG TPA: SDR family NAD(P)-dependent oxidoreductase, partial [Planctomycetota bacterium]|nr:SDR family NAD(P)-dependent oxidoreductase [Planctomycetota bacterium]
MEEKRPAVLVTGAFSGIGLACARRLEEAGFRVFAGGRRPPAAPPGPGTPVLLDVTDRESIALAARAVEAAAPGGLAGLVNNAGVVSAGPLEFLPLDEIRRPFEVNVFGALAVTQAFLPLLRRARGRVVFMSSVSGLVATPFLGPYAASKFALEALGDALRMELSPWGLDVAIVEPGS